MHANVQLRHNPELGTEAPYYHLKVSHSDVHGHVHSLIVLNVGFEPALKPAQVQRIAAALTDRFKNRHQHALFKNEPDGLSDTERQFAEKYWQRTVEEGGIDRFDRRERHARDEAEKYVDINTVEHTNARNAGAEWLCKQTIDRLGLQAFLQQHGWSENAINTAISHLIVRTVYAPSEWATWRIMKENSAAYQHCTCIPF